MRDYWRSLSVTIVFVMYAFWENVLVSYLHPICKYGNSKPQIADALCRHKDGNTKGRVISLP